MIDVSQKQASARKALARGRVIMQPETLRMLKDDRLPKGNAITVAQVAGIMAAKQTSNLIPMCHPLNLENTEVSFIFGDDYVDISAQVKCTGKTGVEMEALMAVAITSLSIYDMCKAVERGIRIENIRLISKSGGTSGDIKLE